MATPTIKTAIAKGVPHAAGPPPHRPHGRLLSDGLPPRKAATVLVPTATASPAPVGTDAPDAATVIPEAAEGPAAIDVVLGRLHWLGHAAFRIDGGPVIYIDPYQIEDGETADVILITHDHSDHCSPADVAKVRGPDTVVVAAGACAQRLGGDVRTVAPGDSHSLAGIQIEVVPAYNIGKNYHPQGAGYVGYVLTLDGARVYHAGDTDHIPEMKETHVDIALLPVGGTYTMDAVEAAEAARDLGAQVAIPMHYGTVVGSAADAQRFEQLCSVRTMIMGLEP